MPKRAIIDDRRKRHKDKMRKRLKREQMACSSDVTTPHDTAKSVVPCRSTDGAVTVPPGSLPGFGLIGFPPLDENPLARMQVSSCVKIHLPALRLSFPWGKSSVCQKRDKCTVPWLTAWVYTQARVLGHDEDSESSQAGQTQLDSSVLRVSSSKSNDEEIKRIFKMASGRENSTDSVKVNQMFSEQRNDSNIT